MASRRPHRRNWLNDGVSLQRMSPRLYRATRALSHADVSIYPVDARGLIGGLSGPAGRPTLTTMTQLAPSFDTSSLEQTERRVFRNTNDLRAAMQRAVADAELTYVLGYYPQDDRFDGCFRKIEVKVHKDDVLVRHRRGYYASTEGCRRSRQRRIAPGAAISNRSDRPGCDGDVRSCTKRRSDVGDANRSRRAQFGNARWPLAGPDRGRNRPASA